MKFDFVRFVRPRLALPIVLSHVCVFIYIYRYVFEWLVSSFGSPKYLKEREENREGEKRRETKILEEKLNNHGGLKRI